MYTMCPITHATSITCNGIGASTAGGCIPGYYMDDDSTECLQCRDIDRLNSVYSNDIICQSYNDSELNISFGLIQH